VVTVTARYDRAIVSSQHSAPADAAMAKPLRPSGPFGRFADDLLQLELPDLPDTRRLETVSFVCRRADQIPTPLRLGIIVLTFALGPVQRVVGLRRTTAVLRSTPLPLVGELARMVRSLGFAYVWETWPDTKPTGARA
jgi:hypothetical protein